MYIDTLCSSAHRLHRGRTSLNSTVRARYIFLFSAHLSRRVRPFAREHAVCDPASCCDLWRHGSRALLGIGRAPRLRTSTGDAWAVLVACVLKVVLLGRIARPRAPRGMVDGLKRVVAAVADLEAAHAPARVALPLPPKRRKKQNTERRPTNRWRTYDIFLQPW